MVKNDNMFENYDGFTYVEGVRDLADMPHVDKAIADVLRDCARQIETLSQGITTPILGTWIGDPQILPSGVDIEILSIDKSCLIDKQFPEMTLPNSHIACWIRWSPENKSVPSYRSCNLGDIELTNDNYNKLPINKF